MANPHARPRRQYEDFVIGDKITTPARTITEADIVRFSGLSGDFCPLYIDAERATATIPGERYAHELLVLSIASGLAWPLHDTIFLSADWTFIARTKAGDTLKVSIEIVQKRRMPYALGGVVILNVEIINQFSEVVQRGVWCVLVRREREDSETPS